MPEIKHNYTKEDVPTEEGVDRIQPPNQVFGDPDAFRAEMEQKAMVATAEGIQKTIDHLERLARTPYASVEIYSEPSLDTFCCVQVPAKKVDEKGDIVEDPNNKSYLIGAPAVYIAGDAPKPFLSGEITHELGHAFYTDWGMLERLKKLSVQETGSSEAMQGLINCIEDPRMERVCSRPGYEGDKQNLFYKNTQLIIPSIAKGLPKMPPKDQFLFLVKLEGLWAVFNDALEGETKPWSLDGLDEKAKGAYEAVRPALEKIIGSSNRPPLKVSAEVERLIRNEIWPVFEKLMQETKDQEQEDKQQKKSKGKGKSKSKKSESGEGKGEKGESEPGKGEPEPGAGESRPGEGEPKSVDPEQLLNPKDPSTWPEPLKQLAQRLIEKHEKKLEQQSQAKKKENEQKKSEASKIEQQRNELLRSRDGFADPEVRKEYNDMVRELYPVIQSLESVFDQYLPKVVEPQYEPKRSGLRFNIARYVRQIGTARSNPLDRRIVPEKKSLILQILVDVSGSMNGERIDNAIKACVAVCEAASGYAVEMEILANDHKNCGDDTRYVLKDFDEDYDGRVKARLTNTRHLEKMVFGGDNEDANAIRAALPRLKQKVGETDVVSDQVGSLVIYISDSTTESADTKSAAEAARKFTAFEGTAITPEADIVEKVRYHFGKDSQVPRSVQEFPTVLRNILDKHLKYLSSD